VAENLINAISKQRSRSFISIAKPPTKFEVSSSSSYKDMFDGMSKIVGVTLPGPRPLSGKLFVRPLGIHHTAAHQI